MEDLRVEKITSTRYMSRRSDLTFAGLILMSLTLMGLVFLLVCQQKGFDPSLCDAYSQCGWRFA